MVSGPLRISCALDPADTRPPLQGDTLNTRTAKTITDLLAPWVVIIAVTAAISWHAAAPGHGIILITGASLGPIAWIRWRVHRGSLTDIHVRDRDQRGGVFIALITSLAIVTCGFAATGAPGRLTALAAAMLTTLLATGAITTKAHFKVSMHTAVAAGAVAITAADRFHQPLTASAVGVLGALAVALIGWARVVIKDHTAAQVVLGCVVGVVCGGAVFAVLM